MIYLNNKVLRGKTSKIGALLVIKILGALFATVVFAKFTPLVDSNLYLSGSYSADSSLRILVVQTLAVMFNDLGGVFFTHVMFGVISCAGVLYYVATGGKRWAILLVLLFPSALIWTSIVSKEALFFGGFTLLLVVWSRFVTDSINRLDLFAAFLAFIFCALLRPHYAVIIVWLFFSVCIVKKYDARAWPILIVALLLGAVAVYFFAWAELLKAGYGNIDEAARASRFYTLGIEPRSAAGRVQFEQFIPLGVLTGIIGPLPEELVKRPEFIPFFIEGVFILLFPLLMYQYANMMNFSIKSSFFRFYWWCLIPGIITLMVLHSPFGILNPGSAIRWRTNFEPIFYMAPLLLFFQFKGRTR